MAKKTFLQLLDELDVCFTAFYEIDLTIPERMDIDTLVHVYSLIRDSVNRSLEDLAK